MQIFLKGLTCGGNTLDVEPTDTVWDLKLKMQDKSGIPPRELRLIWSGRQLQNHRTVADYGIQKEDSLHYILRLYRGYGMFGALWSSRVSHVTVKYSAIFGAAMAQIRTLGLRVAPAAVSQEAA